MRPDRRRDIRAWTRHPRLVVPCRPGTLGLVAQREHGRLCSDIVSQQTLCSGKTGKLLTAVVIDLDKEFQELDRKSYILWESFQPEFEDFGSNVGICITVILHLRCE
jgi:hypothetical protein